MTCRCKRQQRTYDFCTSVGITATSDSELRSLDHLVSQVRHARRLGQDRLLIPQDLICRIFDRLFHSWFRRMEGPVASFNTHWRDLTARGILQSKLKFPALTKSWSL